KSRSPVQTDTEFNDLLRRPTSWGAVAFMALLPVIHIKPVVEVIDSCKKNETSASCWKLRATRPGSEA
ncbi:MAG: hypothetical protein AAFR10_21630, partial [Pseudomonadota bacterium]